MDFYELSRDLLYRIDAQSETDLQFGDPSEDDQRTLRSWPLPTHLGFLLRSCWPKFAIESTHNIYGLPELVAHNRDDQRFLTQRVLLIGSCINGDGLALDWRTEELPVVFVPHQTLCDPEVNDLGPSHPPACRSFAEYLLRIVDGAFVPLDYSSGAAYGSLLATLAKRPPA